MPSPPTPADPAPPGAADLVAEVPEVCPGCGAVLAAVAGDEPVHPGASPSCGRLFEVTLRGLREEASADLTAAAAARLADAAYDAQHPVPGEPDRTSAALHRLAADLGSPAPQRRTGPPTAWTTTIADVAADLDVIDLGVLVDSWARAVLADWTGADDPSTRPVSQI